MSAPMDISPSYLSSRAQDASCAFPSWPQRSSLSDHCEERATSHLSDEDLFPCDTFEDDARSVSSSSSTPTSRTPQHLLTEAEVLEMQRERANYQKEVMRFLMNEKERRRQAMKKQRRGSGGSGSSSSSKKSPKNKVAGLTPIAEAE